MLQLALRRNAGSVAIGHGRSPAAATAAREFARRWEAAGRSVLCAVSASAGIRAPAASHRGTYG